MKILNLTLAAGLGLLAVSGCQQQNSAEPPPITTADRPQMDPKNASPASAEATPAGEKPAEKSAVTASTEKPAAEKPAEAPTEKPAQSAAAVDEKKLEELEAKLEKSPKDPALVKAVAEAHYEIGFAMEYNPDLPPRVKYRGALKHFRRTLALDPTHEKAAKEKKQIEDVYRSMGMPIPE